MPDDRRPVIAVTYTKESLPNNAYVFRHKSWEELRSVLELFISSSDGGELAELRVDEYGVRFYLKPKEKQEQAVTRQDIPRVERPHIDE